jgi:hypothetical protein
MLRYEFPSFCTLIYYMLALRLTIRAFGPQSSVVHCLGNVSWTLQAAADYAQLDVSKFSLLT